MVMAVEHYIHGFAHSNIERERPLVVVLVFEHKRWKGRPLAIALPVKPNNRSLPSPGHCVPTFC